MSFLWMKGPPAAGSPRSGSGVFATVKELLNEFEKTFWQRPWGAMAARGDRERRAALRILELNRDPVVLEILEKARRSPHGSVEDEVRRLYDKRKQDLLEHAEV